MHLPCNSTSWTLKLLYAVTRVVSAGQRGLSSALQPPVATPQAGQPRSTQLQAVKERTKAPKALTVADV